MRCALVVLVAAGCGLLGACSSGSRVPHGAVLLFDVSFGSPENTVGEPPKVYESGSEQTFPSTIASQIFLGAPKVVDRLCGLDKQPVQLAAASGTQGHEGLEFLLDQRYGHYHVELDLCVASLGLPPKPANEPQLAIFLDIPEAYALGLFEGGRIVVLDPARGMAAVNEPQVIGQYAVDKPMHIAIDFDLIAQSLSVAVDAKTIYTGKLDAYLARAVRVVIRGNPTNLAAFDNFFVWAENDRTAGAPEPLAPKTGPEQ